MTNETFAEIIAEMRFHGQQNIDAEKDKPEYGILTVEGRIAQNYADRLDAAHKREYDEMLDALVRIGNWCAQDLAENAYVSEKSGNYLKTLNGLCEVCRPFMQKASRLKRYGGVE